MKKVLVALVALGLVVVACSDDDRTPRGGDALADVEAGGRDALACTTITATEPGDRACVPSTAKANSPLTIELRSKGCGSCYATFSCVVSVDASAITITMRSDTCTPGPDALCDAACIAPRATCALPALAAGTYTVMAAGEPTRATPRELVVADDATETSCAISEQPGPVDLTSFSRTCAVDTDCVAVTADVCGTCACPTEAIAKSEQTRFDGASRAASSQCFSRESQIVCAACPSTSAACGAGGRCEIR